MASTAEVVKHFIEQRRKGRRVSIDAILDGMKVQDRDRTRTEALKTISLAARSTQGFTHSGDAEALDLSHELHGLPELEGYDLIDLVGQGGMGRVYEGYQQSTGRRVAVKFLLETTTAGKAARRRFEREVELVVRLQHPSIVSILDSGILKGRYFYVMEYIEGQRLDEALVPGECDVRQAMQLVQQICDTVDYAHQRGVLHRDLKPSNIIVDQRGQAHILDFGLAKALDRQSDRGLEITLSEPGQVLGTLAYMPPEQAQGRVQLMSVRSDVYSLGAISYELLTGELPCDTSGPLNESLQNIVHQEPHKPHSLRARLHADVGAIALKALEKSPDRRYATAGELSADIGRFLANEPVVARPPTTAVRVVRWARRNRAVASVAAISLVLIIATTSLYVTWLLDERGKLREALDATMTLLWSADVNREGLGAQAHPVDVVDEWASRVGTMLLDQPELQARIRTSIGERYMGYDNWEKARRQFQVALDQRIKIFGPEHPEVATSYHNLGRVLYWEGDFREARKYYEKALAMRMQLLGKRHPSVIATQHHLAAIYYREKDYAKAEESYREIMAYRREHFGDQSKEVANVRNNLGKVLIARRKFSEAEPLLMAALETLQTLEGDNREPIWETLSMHNLALCLAEQGRFEDAERWYQRALSRKEKLKGPESKTVAITLECMADLKLKQAQCAEAQRLVRRAATIFEGLGDERNLDKCQTLLSEILQNCPPAPASSQRAAREG